MLLKVSTMAVATTVMGHGAMEEGGQCWVWVNHGSCNPCRCDFSTTNLSIVADHYVARHTAPCQKAIVQEWLEERKRKVFGIPFLQVTKMSFVAQVPSSTVISVTFTSQLVIVVQMLGHVCLCACQYV